MNSPTTRREYLRQTTTHLAIMNLGSAVLVGIAVFSLIRQGWFSTPKGYAISVPLGIAALWSLVSSWISWRTRSRLRLE